MKQNEGKKVVLPLPAGVWKDAKDFRSHGYKKNSGEEKLYFSMGLVEKEMQGNV